MNNTRETDNRGDSETKDCHTTRWTQQDYFLDKKNLDNRTGRDPQETVITREDYHERYTIKNRYTVFKKAEGENRENVDEERKEERTTKTNAQYWAIKSMEVNGWNNLLRNIRPENNNCTENIQSLQYKNRPWKCKELGDMVNHVSKRVVAKRKMKKKTLAKIRITNLLKIVIGKEPAEEDSFLRKNQVISASQIGWLRNRINLT